MNGIHDMGGMDGFGRIQVEPDEPVFHEPWERRVFGINLLLLSNIDAGRYAIECIDPVEYLSLPYYGRWLRALEAGLEDRGVLAEGELEARIQGRPFPSRTPPPPTEPPNPNAGRAIDREPAFAVGQRVRTRNLQPPGHTRLPAYARGRRGVVALVHPPFVFPDTHAHELGECPQHVYAVRFEGRELWGDRAEPGTHVHLDCFEDYLEASG